MEGIDLRLMITLGGMIISVVTTFAIVRQKLSSVIEQLHDIKADYESRLRELDRRSDKCENMIDLNSQKTAVLSSIMAPDKLERGHRELERMLVLANNNHNRIEKLEKMHNGKHPPIN